MAQLGETFNTENLPEDQGNFEPIPAGWYTATIGEADLRDTKAGTGQYVSVRYNITGPTHEGRVVFGNLNIRNPNPKAEEIGRQQLGSIMRAIGLPSVQDTDQLIGGNLQIKVSIQKSEEYGDKNEVKGFKAIDGARPPVASEPAQQAAQPAAAAAPPWARK